MMIWKCEVKDNVLNMCRILFICPLQLLITLPAMPRPAPNSWIRPWDAITTKQSYRKTHITQHKLQSHQWHVECYNNCETCVTWQQRAAQDNHKTAAGLWIHASNGGCVICGGLQTMSSHSCLVCQLKLNSNWRELNTCESCEKHSKWSLFHESHMGIT